MWEFCIRPAVRLDVAAAWKARNGMEERYPKAGRSIFCIGDQARIVFLLYIHLVSVFECLLPGTSGPSSRTALTPSSV